MADVLTAVALILSLTTLALIVYLLITIRRKATPTEQVDNEGLKSKMDEVKGMVSGLNSTLTPLLTTIGEIKQNTVDTTSGMSDLKRLADLLGGSSQKKGEVGEILVREYLEKLPRTLWEEQCHIAGSSDRVDFALRIPTDGTECLLPIDSKFSLPDDIEDFSDQANVLAKKRAGEIVKYIVPGKTTDFAVMVVPNSVFYALTHETVLAIEAKKVIPCPPEGIIMLCTLAMRAQQGVVLARSAEKLRGYVLEIDSKLKRVRDDIGKLAKNLDNGSRYAKQTLGDLDDTRSALQSVSTNLDEPTAKVATRQIEGLTLAPIAEEKEKPTNEN